MSVVDVESLLQSVAPDHPCGENLEYDPDFAAMEKAAAGKEEQQFGSTVIPAEDPNWRDVRRLATALFSRTKDLRVAVQLTRALLRTAGLEGLRDGLQLIHGLIERFWDGVHPTLDPDDDNDPTIRINLINSLCDPQAVLRPVREAPLIQVRGVGNFSYRDWLTITGEIPPAAGAEKPDPATFEAAFTDCDITQLQQTAEAVAQAKEAAENIESACTTHVGSMNSPNLETLTELLVGIGKLLQERMSRRGVFDKPAEAEEDVANSDASETAIDEPTNGRAPAARISGEISSREDVIRTLDKICDYYRRNEPSSPVPLFLNRAKRLASKSFLEILRDITPEALSQALAIGGLSDGEGESGGMNVSDDDL